MSNANNAKPKNNPPKLNSALWDAANTLRGSAVDRTDWKGYILPLLFFKRICDVWDEETADATETFGDAGPSLFPEVHRFHVPDGCHWRDIRETSTNVGTALLRAMQEIERANPDTLYRVFGAADWSNKEKFADELLKDLVEGFSSIPLGNEAVSTDVLGDAYEYLIGKFADVTRRNKAGEFYTPRSIVRMIVEILDPQEGESIYDPACGTGGMLLGAIDHVARQGGDPRTFFGKIYGQEKNLTTSSIARMNLVLHGIEDFQIAREDTLRSPAFSDPSTGGLLTFDCVIANPPFSLQEWGYEVWENDPWGRVHFDMPPKGCGDFAWVQHMLKSTAVRSGRMAIVLPVGALFNSGAEEKIRAKLIHDGCLEAVIALGPNIFYGTGIPACVLVFRNKRDDAEKSIFMIDAFDQYDTGRNQNYFTDGHAANVLGWYRDRQDIFGRCRHISLDELRVNRWSLYEALYIDNDHALRYASKGTLQAPAAPDVAGQRLAEALEAAREADHTLTLVLASEGGNSK